MKKRCRTALIRYDTKLDVQRAWRKGMEEGRRSSGYHHCDNCDGWHLGKDAPAPPDTCWATSKKKFWSPDTARQQMKHIQNVRAARGHQGDVEAAIYRCKHCDTYHLTSHYLTHLGGRQ